MKNYFKKITYSLALLFLLSAPIILRAETSPTTSPDLGADLPKISNPLNNPDLRVSIPGFSGFRDITCDEATGDKNQKLYCVVPWIADYINGIYKYGIGIIVILAVIVMMIAGVIWLTAGGNETKIHDAKQWIGGGLLGIFIAVSSYLILSIINPALTELSPIKLRYISEFTILPLEPEGNNEETPEISKSLGNYPSVGGSCFPLAKNSFSYSTWGFGDRRSEGSRCHAGVDLYTKGPAHAVAIADGTVLSTGHFYDCSGGSVNAVVIDHGDYVANYGEIDSNKVNVSSGQKVKAGDILGIATRCGMLHFELYEKGSTSTQRWYPNKTIPSIKNWCRDNSAGTKPDSLLDPTNTLKSLESKMCGQ